MKRHVICFVEKAGFEPRTLGTKAERYDHCTTRLVEGVADNCVAFLTHNSGSNECVCVCVCARARAGACVCACVRVSVSMRVRMRAWMC